MSRSLNKVFLIGNVGKEPEIKYTTSKTPITTFRLATTETWKDKDGNTQEHTDWMTIVAWRGLAEVIHKIVKKGSRVFVEGRIQTRTYDDKFGNHKHYVEIVADNLLLLDAKKHNGDTEEFLEIGSELDTEEYIDDYDTFAKSAAGKDNDDFLF